ncbi:hypothetical protein [Paenibacillus puerhi]|uniref:hypothetical protein n=1 Tax=Paenibacillus puerhi TaxID=2692622 RepID=UPI0013573EEA|nr:hypothetical protein [Paenibacillus puerhi]
MIKNGFASKWTSAALILCLVVSLFPVVGLDEAYGAESSKDQPIFLDGTRIGNASTKLEDVGNAFRNFNVSGSGFAGSPGFVQTETDKDMRIYADGGMRSTGDWATVQFEIRVKDNPLLREMAAGGTAEIVVGWDRLIYDSGLFWTAASAASFRVDNVELLGGHSGGGTIGHREKTGTFHANSVIHIGAFVEDEDAGIDGLFIKFQDKVRPELSSYTFTGSGVERKNKKGEYELFAKAKETVSLSYNFSKAVRPSVLAADAQLHDFFLRHPLYVTPSDDLLPTRGQEQYMMNKSYKSSDFTGKFLDTPLRQSITYTYTAAKFHHSGNRPVEPRIKATDQAPDVNRGLIDLSLEEKLNQVVLVDAAGNAAKTIGATVPGSNSSLEQVKGKAVPNPFDFNKGGYRVIIDAVAPKYSKSGNGIQPEIVTGATVNDQDVLDFTVQFTEDVVARDDRNGNPFDPAKMYLLFNNGMRAYYYDGDNNANLGYGTPNVRFRMVVPPGVQVETPLLKAIALTHERKDNYPDSNYQAKDKNVIQDYAGNQLIQPANYEGLHEDIDPERTEPAPAGSERGDFSNVNSKIDWAKLSVDNTAPLIGFHFENDGATDAIFKKRGKITIDVNDPPVAIPVLDPEYHPVTNFERPSRGIYRPSNMTGPSSPAVGLVYYTWTRSEANPLETDEQYAALKRFSLTAKQPREELYPGKFPGLNLSVANNKTNMIAPPAEAFTADGSGVWYLHAWTADMTWDTARELMQYKKMKEYKKEHPDQYKAWKDEYQGSESDKEFYADNKALAAVGQYDDLNVWKLEDFKHADSNWTHSSKPILLDNQAPQISLSNLVNDGSANVEVTMTITDAHSGLKESFYQWVMEGSELQDIDWKPVVLVGGSFISGTRNEVAEDGSYRLYVKAVDLLGNESPVTSSVAATVNSKALVTGSFSESDGKSYLQSHDVTFYLNNPQTLNVTSVTYSTYARTVTGSTYGAMALMLADPYQVSSAYSYSSARPDASEYRQLEGTAGSAGGYAYIVPADPALNGKQYLHITVKETAADRYYYFLQSYLFDNTPPKVVFSTDEDLYPRARQEVQFAARDELNELAFSKYQWVKQGDAPPDASSLAWKVLADGERYAVIDAAGLNPGESADYKLYVYARDMAGNEAVTASSGYFKVSKPVIQPPADAKSDLLYVFGDREEGYTAIIQLSLDVLDKAGYEYSVSPDFGKSWIRWKPYTNYVAIKVPAGNVQNGQILVRYKTGPQSDGSEGTIGAAKPLDTAKVSPVEPVYALVTLGTTSPVSTVTGVDIDIAAPLGIKVVPSAVNPSPLERSGNSFHVKANGYYSFDLTDTSNPDRKATLYAVVSNIDSTPPTGRVERVLAEQDITSGNVIVKLKPSEPVRITNNNGSNTYTFKENGTFAFEFLDEAGNSGTASYTVNSIDREGPKAIVTRSYTKSDGTEYATFESGGILYAAGVTLTVERPSKDDKEIFVPTGSTIYMTDNGTAEFMVYDKLGNMTLVREAVTNLIGAPPQADAIQYTLIDEAGHPVPESSKVLINGQLYAKGKMQVAVSGQTSAPNQVFEGTAPSKDAEENYTNLRSQPDGSFVVTRTFSADGSIVIAISDLLGNINKIPVTVKGLDNKAPEITLHAPTVGIARNKPDFDFAKDLGGYTVRDNVSASENIQVTISGLDLAKAGRQNVTYRATDQVGNVATVVQEVVVVDTDGMLIFGNDQLISASSAESALFDRSTLSFKITGFNRMKIGSQGQEQVNERGTFDLFYYSGLFREGQMKTIASKLTYDELVNRDFQVTFPKAGWYTLIVRSQEREREYATFFISKKD